MKRLIITYLTLILLSSCGTGFVVRKYTEGCFHENMGKTEPEKMLKDSIIIKKFKKGSVGVTRIRSKGPDITIKVDENNIPLETKIQDTIKLNPVEEKHKAARIKSIEKHARISRVIFWLPVFGFIHNVSYLKKANGIESKYKVDLSAEKNILRKSIFLSIPFLFVGALVVLIAILYALSAGASVFR